MDEDVETAKWKMAEEWVRHGGRDRMLTREDRNEEQMVHESEEESLSDVEDEIMQSDERRKPRKKNSTTHAHGMSRGRGKSNVTGFMVMCPYKNPLYHASATREADLREL